MLCCPINNYFDFMQIQSINTQPTRRRHTKTNALAKYGKAQHHIISIADAVCCNWRDESYVNRGAPLFTMNLWLCFQRFVFTFCWIICYLPVHLNIHINNRAPHFHNWRECRPSNSLPWRRCFPFHRSLSGTAEPFLCLPQPATLYSAAAAVDGEKYTHHKQDHKLSGNYTVAMELRGCRGAADIYYYCLSENTRSPTTLAVVCAMVYQSYHRRSAVINYLYYSNSTGSGNCVLSLHTIWVYIYVII